ncbi:hypothetical protein NMG60_11014486 [Bertholletia excelsa]
MREMKLARGALRSVNVGLQYQLRWPQMFRTFSTSPNSGSNDDQSTKSFESAEDFENRIFGDVSGSSPMSSSFFEKLDRIEKAHDRSKFGVGKGSEFLDGLDESFSTLSDGMGGKLKEAAKYFEYDSEEVEREDYTFRPDINFPRGTTYTTKDLDLTKPGVRKTPKRYEFETTTAEVLKKADFRNVRFLANFLTEAGIIIKRSQTGISAKAQRKVAREIKTARAFGLLPFTTMGTKRFVVGLTMESLDKDYEYELRTDMYFVNGEDIQDSTGT